ncbi:GNAT family acetyltransferase [Microbacterium sp. W4I20]|uniref:GNAT family acetyltransferase n=1 Tax=Microbacterium sp. W4I20 TaxID=3042262 RepID=UPI002786D58E|nr:GNAT family acetyltransferase [Microbacterium sp. W4I20]MDQ0726351.1 ribosomal protein S18 acetylase RimI-like enzyme [Microbacterium sp. W4I20]
MAVEIRPLTDVDVEPVVALWEETGLTRPWNDPREDIRRARAVWPELLLVATDQDALVGTVMAGYDGHRGWLYYLATSPERRGEGVGRRLVEEAESRLLALGCPKVMLMVRAGNDAVLEFYDGIDYTRESTLLTGKRLIPDG